MTKQQPPVLRTALKRPAPPVDLVQRARLQKLLFEHSDRDFTLVSAPAGYGKSTLVSSWLDSCELPSGWLSLDEQDDDPHRFFASLIAAIRTIDESSCHDTKLQLEGADLPPTSTLAGYLSNDLEEIGEPFVLVIDDYHRIHNQTIHAVLRDLVEHPPRPLHLVLITRRDPPLPMAGLRARSSVVEIREQDLRFNLEETKTAIRNMAGISVADETLEDLHAAIEGWVVGLRLVCLALRHQADPEDYLHTLHGGTANIKHYLLEEVLNRLSPEFRSSMLRVSILDRFCPEVIDVLCNPASSTNPSASTGGEIVRALQQNNLFTIGLDEQGVWFRFHHLFQELLRRQLMKEASAEDVAVLYMRASKWFESQGLITEAIHYSLAAGDDEGAADLVVRHRHDEINTDRWHVVESWLRMLPVEVRLRSPGVPLTESWIAYWRWEMEKLGPLVERAASLIDEKTEGPILLGELDFFNGQIAYWLEADPAIAVELLERAQSRLRGAGPIIEGRVEMVLTLARCLGGQCEMAAESLEQRIRRLDPDEDILRSLLLATLVLVHLTSGDALASRVPGEQFHTVSKKARIVNSAAWAAYYTGQGYFQCLDLGQAADRFAEALRRPSVLEIRGVLDAFAGLAITQQLAGDQESAEQTMGRFMSYAREHAAAYYLILPQSCRARLSVLQGDPASAASWVSSAAPALALPELSIWLENPSITKARVLIALGSDQSLSNAAGLLETIRTRCEAWHLRGQTIEVAVLQSLALEKQGRHDEALATFDNAVDLAAPGRWVRPFVEAGPAMATMLARLPKAEQNRPFATRLRLALSEKAGARPRSPSEDQPLIEALTNRERDVLELLAQRLYDKEIGAALSISVGTVKTHLKHMYGKLAVSNRREAVAKAEELGLVN